MSWWMIGVLAAATFAFRLAGPLLRQRIHVGPGVVRLMNLAAVAVLVSLAATSTFYQAGSFAGWARVTGVAVAALLIWRRAPFVVVVLAAAVVAAALRALGVG